MAVALLLALPGNSPAEDITLRDGVTLREATVKRHDDESVTISHSSGVARVQYDRLPQELQERFGMTPQEVDARREKARLAERERALAREKKQEEQRAALVQSSLSPRYVTGADVLAIYAAWEPTLPAPVAEYLAAEWNRREAQRCGLTVEADRYRQDAAKLQATLRQEQEKNRAARDAANGAAAQLAQVQSQLKQARSEIQALKKQLADQPASQTTVIQTTPTIVPVYRPAPVVIPPPTLRPAPPVRPTPPVPPRPQVPSIHIRPR